MSDVWVTVALIGWLRAAGAVHARRWALISAGFMLLAIVPEQYAELALVTGFVGAPPTPTWSAQLSLYMWLTGTWAATGYTLMTACWLLALRSLSREGGERPAVHVRVAGMGRAGAALRVRGVGGRQSLGWAPHASPAPLRAFQLASLLNGVAFPALLLLGVAIARFAGELQLSWTAGPRAPVWPVAHARIGRTVARIAGSQGVRDLVRAAQSWLPFPRLRSDVSDVLYLNWLVPADALEALLPQGMRAQRFGAEAMLSILVYRHGHFGPALLGPLRRRMPSPLQCNVRAYVQGGAERVVFLSNAIDHPAYFAGSRLLSDGLPVHYPASFELTRSGPRLAVAIEPGAGSALALRATVEENDAGLAPRSVRQAFRRRLCRDGVHRSAERRRECRCPRWASCASRASSSTCRRGRCAPRACSGRF